MVTAVLNSGSDLGPEQPDTALRVVDVDIRSDDRWERFVDEHPAALIFHHPLWMQVLQREYGRRSMCLACEREDGKLEGVLPLFLTRGLPLGIGGAISGARLSSLPRTPLAGPLCLSRRAAGLLVKAAVELLKKSKAETLQIKAHDNNIEGLVRGVEQQPWRTSYGVVLPEQRRALGSEECEQKFGPCDTCRILRFGNCANHRHITWAVKKARGQDVTVEEGKSETDLQEWYDIYLETMRRNFVPPRPFRLFQAFWDLLRPAGCMRFLIARQPSGYMIGGTILLVFRNTTFAAFAASREKYFSCHPNDLLHWVGIHQACREGSQIYDFGEVPGDAPELARFKRKWNCAETQLLRYYYPPPKSSRSRLSRPGIGKKLIGGMWARVPLKVTAVIGDWIYSRL